MSIKLYNLHYLYKTSNYMYKHTQKVKNQIINYLTTNKLLKTLCFKS